MSRSVRGAHPPQQGGLFGLAVGELHSMLSALIGLYIHMYWDVSVFSLQSVCPSSPVCGDLFGMVLSLAAKSYVQYLLISVAAVTIPPKRLFSGLDSTRALSVSGAQTGMPMSMCFVPCAQTRSVAVRLPPPISESHRNGDREAV